MHIGNPDIRIPVEKTHVECPGHGEEMEEEDTEAEETQSNGTRDEQSHPDQQTHEENLDGGQGSPEMWRLVAPAV
ncbi:hypothetical protein NDU88_000145 [Pleurodeles waltl]|uniref:Uncharacterized protein n=1 Tax=Pleurodeles waltl TaxID=8319 RepID=A0AAV7R4X6_PLEWA|nr:hypothetical protein NDU88_000145 [Pleurodeles waltl]